MHDVLIIGTACGPQQSSSVIRFKILHPILAKLPQLSSAVNEFHLHAPDICEEIGCQSKQQENEAWQHNPKFSLEKILVLKNACTRLGKSRV